MYSQSILDDIKNRLSIVEVIGEKVSLKRAGRNFKSLCPFHSDSKPSFIVSEEKQIYHCFGCGEGGNVFSFVMKTEGLSFIEAVKQLAERAGVTLPTLSNEDASRDKARMQRRKLAYRANQLAMEYFIATLGHPQKGAGARNYLISRGFDEAFFKQHLLGLAEDGWDGLVSYLTEKNVPLDLAADLGLVKSSEKSQRGYYDFFRHRLMFPIISPNGDVLGFSGRALSKEDEERAKFINSPDSLVYNKSRSMYGLDVAATAIRHSDEVLLVEGNMDRLRLVQAGLVHAVAPLGTALTEDQIRLLKRFTQNMVLIFDGDSAGQKAAIRSLPLFLEQQLFPRAVVLPAEHDPDSFIAANGVDALQKMIARASSLFEYAIDVIGNEEGTDPRGAIQAMNRLKPYFDKLNDPVAIGIYARNVAMRLQMDEQTVRQAVQARKPISSEPRQRKRVGVSQFAAERLLIELLVNQPRAVVIFLETASIDDVRHPGYHTILSMVIDEFEQTGSVHVSRLIDRIQDADVKRELLSLSMNQEDIDMPEWEQVLNDCIAKLKQKGVTTDMKELNRAIQQAEQEGDDERVMELVTKKHELMFQRNETSQ